MAVVMVDICQGHERDRGNLQAELFSPNEIELIMAVRSFIFCWSLNHI